MLLALYRFNCCDQKRKEEVHTYPQLRQIIETLNGRRIQNPLNCRRYFNIGMDNVIDFTYILGHGPNSEATSRCGTDF